MADDKVLHSSPMNEDSDMNKPQNHNNKPVS